MVSFGSVLGDTAGLNESLLQGMADAFSKLPQKIIWKMKLEGTFIERIIYSCTQGTVITLISGLTY